MAKFTSQYQSLGFYVNDELKRFSNGQYVTDGKDEIAVLATLKDVEQAVEQPETKTEAKPATKAPVRKASAK